MKDVALSSVARLIVIAFQLVNIKLYATYLGAEQLGMYFFLLTVSYSASSILFVPVDYYQQANLAKTIAATGGARAFLEFNRRLTVLYFGASLIIIAACSVIDPKYASYALLAVILAYALYVVQALRNTLNNLGYGNVVSISFIQEAVLKVSFFYVLTRYFQASEFLLIIAWIVSLGLSGFYLLHKASRFRVFAGSFGHRILAREVFQFAYPISIGAVCNWLQLQGYRLILVPLGFAEEVGIFATLSNIGSAAIGAVALIYGQQFTPLLYKTSGQYTARYLKGAIVAIVGVLLVAFAGGEFAVRILTKPEFVQHWELLLFGVATDGSILLVAALMISVTLTGHTKQFLLASIIGLLSMVSCFAVLYWASELTVITIGIPLLISQWVIVVYMYMLFRKIANKSAS